MKAYALLSTILYFFFFTGNSFAAVMYSSINSTKPLLVVLLMVKNEAEVIVPTLETYIAKNMQTSLPDTEEVAYVIYDTGSTDGTQQIAKDFFEKRGVKNFHIENEPFVNYAASRNRGLELVEKIFPYAPFILFVDAEWYLNDFESLLGYCRVHKVDNPLLCRCYNLHIIDYRSSSFCIARLIRSEAKVRFKGRVHEIPQVFPAATLPEDIFIKFDPKKAGNERTQRRWPRDRDWLLEDYRENPNDKRTVYLLAQTYVCLQDWENARKFFFKVIHDFDTKDEFTYLAYYNLGEITEHLNAIAGKSGELDWYEPFDYYLKAYSLRPHRAEPLIKIANHYRNTNEMALCYLFARKACKVSYPSDDTLFVEKGMYEFDRHWLLGVCAWYVGDYKNGEKALRKALAIQPENSALLRDLSFYECRQNKG